MKNEIKYLHDFEIDERLNEKLIKGLTVCFPHEEIFKKQRFVKELPQHRWIIEHDDEIAAHVALHEKTIAIEKATGEEVELKIGGIAEVFTQPGYRRRGLVKLLLNEAHSWMIANDIDFSILFGDKNVYGSSGYKVIENSVKYYDPDLKKWKVEKIDDVLVKLLTDAVLPDGIVDLRGPKF